MSDPHSSVRQTMLAEFRKPADHGAVIREHAVAMQLLKVRKGQVDVIQHERAPGMPGQLDALPGGEVQKNLPPGFFQLFFNKLDFFFKPDAKRMFLRVGPKIVQLVLQFDDRFLEIELMFHALYILVVFQLESI